MASNADWATKDYYKTLGVPKDADQAAIKKAYRKLARENHPDSKPGDKAAEDRFKAVAEAYDVVGDPEKRKQYDETRSLFGSGGPVRRRLRRLPRWVRGPGRARRRGRRVRRLGPVRRPVQPRWRRWGASGRSLPAPRAPRAAPTSRPRRRCRSTTR